MPYAARMTIMPLPFGSQANARRGTKCGQRLNMNLPSFGAWSSPDMIIPIGANG